MTEKRKDTMNSKADELKSRINDRYKRMSKGQKALASYITDCYDKAAFLTATDLGQKVGVSESTVVRFATCLGYTGYREFQMALADMVKNQLPALGPTEVPYLEVSREDVFLDTLDQDIENIKKTEENLDRRAFELSVDLLIGARRVYIIGLRDCDPVASYLAFRLGVALDDVRLLSTNSSQEIFEQLMGVNGEDVIIGVSFPRYSMRTLKALEYASTKQAKVITITDSIHSPMNLYSSCNLTASCVRNSYGPSLTAAFSVVDAISMAVTGRRKEEVAEHLSEMEKIWKEYQYYENDELDPVKDSVRRNF